MNWFDRTLLAIAPGIALKRMRNQAAALMYSNQTRRYEAATTGRRTSGWRNGIGLEASANAEMFYAGIKLRAKARDMERNNGWAAKALNVIVGNTVGTGIRMRPSGKAKGKLDLANAVWPSWAETRACDFDGVLDFYGIQALALRSVARDGEVLVVRRRERAGNTGLPLQIQVIEIDQLDTSRMLAEDESGNRVIQGVEVDDNGRAVAYWIFPRHPGDVTYFRAALVSQRVPVEDVLHLYDKSRPGQLRAASWLAPIMLPLQDLDDFEDAQLMKQKAAACYAAFITDASGADDALNDPNANDPDLPDQLEPGMLQVLPPGKDIKFGDPPTTDGYSDYIRAILRKVAAGLGITYESLTGDLSQTNFSGSRMGWLEFHRNVEAWRWRIIIPQLCDPVWAWFVEAAAIAGYDLRGLTAEWTPPRRDLISPKDDVLAEQMAVRSGFKSWSESVREAGYDPEAVLAEMAQERKRFDELGLVLDCDARRTTIQGQAQADPMTSPPPAA